MKTNTGRRRRGGIHSNYEYYIGKQVRKVSGKPFKSGSTNASVYSVGINSNTGKPAFYFHEDDSVVDCDFCKPADGVFYNEQVEWLRKVSKCIPEMPQRQDSSTDQLRDLQVIANRLGCYDAADVIRNLLVK